MTDGEIIIHSANMYLDQFDGKSIKYMFALLIIISPFIAHFKSF